MNPDYYSGYEGYVDAFRERIDFIKDNKLKEALKNKFLVYIYIKNITLTKHINKETILNQEINLYAVTLLVSMMEALIFYLIKSEFDESAGSLLVKNVAKYSNEKSFELKNGKVLVLAEKSFRKEILPPSLAHMLDFVASKKVFNIKLIAAMREMKDVRNSVHIYDITKGGAILNDEDVEKHQDVWGRVFLEVESILVNKNS